MITEPAPAKINLALHVRRRRPDSYHDLETLFAFCAHGDTVTVEPAERHAFAISHPGSRAAEAITDRVANLVTRAADAFTAAFAVSGEHRITLTKRLPVASGIGGGSADAAATLRALARLHGVAPEDPRLLAVAAGLGADVPACLLGRVALGIGKGDALQPLEPIGHKPVLLVNPGVGVSTAAVFARWDGVDRGGLATGGSTLERARCGRNDLEAPARSLAPVIDEVLAFLSKAPGTVLARMSGSGATCFALFADQDACRSAATAVRARHPRWWTLATVVR